PAHWILRAAFSSRSRISPQVGQTCVRTERLFSTRSPHPLQSWEVYAGGTACTRFPAHSALKARITRKLYHPASLIDLFRPAFALAPLCAYPPVPPGFAWRRRLRLLTCKSSR